MVHQSNTRSPLRNCVQYIFHLITIDVLLNRLLEFLQSIFVIGAKIEFWKKRRERKVLAKIHIQYVRWASEDDWLFVGTIGIEGRSICIDIYIVFHFNIIQTHTHSLTHTLLVFCLVSTVKTNYTCHLALHSQVHQCG